MLPFKAADLYNGSRQQHSPASYSCMNELNAPEDKTKAACTAKLISSHANSMPKGLKESSVTFIFLK